MAQPLTEQERERIRDLCRAGKSRNDIAHEVGRSPDTVSRVAADMGHEFGQTNLARAHAARRAYGAEARAERLAKAHERMDMILERMVQPHRKYNFGGKENTLNWVDLEEPDSDMLKQYASAYANLSRAEADTLRQDARSEDVDQASGLIVDLVTAIRDRQ